ncbi:uncharacterized protein LOC113359471 [Papaver somniferum]|uniref:uncharacterized protein LOC113359471 n=1 Tax=Papaver somniferum TaxID=3469 RepID=UPI000E70208C|nr:uncharacterized protein LOC113359471 [Papaver somniferum]
MDLEILISSSLVATLLLLSSIHNFYKAEGRIVSEEEDLELDRQLKILNKPLIKTIVATNGDIVDCIDIYRQPAFDNPLLKNHEHKVKRIIKQELLLNEANASSKKISVLEHYYNESHCPFGTVPIIRTTKKQLVNAKRFSQRMKRSGENAVFKPTGRTHFVSLETSYIKNKTYLGAWAQIQIKNPDMAPDQFTTAQISVQNGPGEDVNSIEFGWAVYPELFSDADTRIFAYWTGDGYKRRGCFNMLCSGFVLVNHEIPLGASLANTGRAFLGSRVVRDPQPDDGWWLYLLDIKIGFFPKPIFTHPEDEATIIKYGGLANAEPNKPFPQMGAGSLPDFDFEKSCHFTHMRVYDKNGEPGDFDPNIVQMRHDASVDCYDLAFYGRNHTGWGLTMSFGGPGGSC